MLFRAADVFTWRGRRQRQRRSSNASSRLENGHTANPASNSVRVLGSISVGNDGSNLPTVFDSFAAD